MAKPIRATPVLTGACAIAFINKMHNKDKYGRLTKVEKMHLEGIKANEKLFSSV